MSVAEKVEIEQSPVNVRMHLGVASLIGGAIFLFALWSIFAGLPQLWDAIIGIKNAFLSGALLMIASLLLIVGWIYFGFNLEKNNTSPGLRAGIVFGALFIYLGTWLTISVIGGFLSGRSLGEGMGVALSITVAIGAALLFLIYKLFTSAGFTSWLRRIEDQGWFHAIPYKPSQGVRVRRATVLALMVIAITGIYTLVSHGGLSDRPYQPNPTGHANAWYWNAPFATAMFDADRYIYLMFRMNVIMPILLALVSLWFAWRIVNWPVFADFLIATEAEMNKVSWTSRKRLVQDTIVVLVTVFLMTLFLFFVDILWINVLSWRPIGVLQVDVRTEALKQQEKTQW